MKLSTRGRRASRKSITELLSHFIVLICSLMDLSCIGGLSGNVLAFSLGDIHKSDAATRDVLGGRAALVAMAVQRGPSYG
jgi:hypothetical protein